jgi:hypothetical protein
MRCWPENTEKQLKYRKNFKKKKQQSPAANTSPAFASQVPCEEQDQTVLLRTISEHMERSEGKVVDVFSCMAVHQGP